MKRVLFVTFLFTVFIATGRSAHQVHLQSESRSSVAQANESRSIFDPSDAPAESKLLQGRKKKKSKYPERQQFVLPLNHVCACLKPSKEVTHLPAFIFTSLPYLSGKGRAPPSSGLVI
jgi:hypothetical protein